MVVHRRGKKKEPDYSEAADVQAWPATCAPGVLASSLASRGPVTLVAVMRVVPPHHRAIVGVADVAHQNWLPASAPPNNVGAELRQRETSACDVRRQVCGEEVRHHACRPSVVHAEAAACEPLRCFQVVHGVRQSPSRNSGTGSASTRLSSWPGAGPRTGIHGVGVARTPWGGASAHTVSRTLTTARPLARGIPLRSSPCAFVGVGVAGVWPGLPSSPAQWQRA